MESTIDKNNIENEKAGFWHSGWAYLLFLGGLVLVFVFLYFILEYFGLT